LPAIFYRDKVSSRYEGWMGRRPIGEQAMTAAERQQRRRDKLKAAIAQQAARQAKRGAAHASQEIRALRGELARLQAAGTFFDLLHDTPEEIARQIVNRVPLTKAASIAGTLAQYVRNRQSP
jgi:hypothetical protein